MRYSSFYILIISLITLAACQESNNNEVLPDEIKISKKNQIVEVEKQKKPFKLEFQLKKIDSENYNLVTTISLDKGSYIISPFSQDTVYGHFELTLKDSNNLVFTSKMTESPNSKTEFDPIIKDYVNFVRTNTTYSQHIKILNKEDFEVSGNVWFLIEPLCSPVDIEYILSYNSGNLSVIEGKMDMLKKVE